MPPADTLTTLALDALKGATGALLRGGSSAAWLRAMQAALVKAHTAAFMAGQAERLGVNVSTLKGLSRAERDDIKQQVAAQLDYLRGFAGALDGLSEAQIAARAALYAGAVRSTYSRARYPKLPFYPGEGTECKGQCKCSWQDNGDGSYTWVLGASEHCATCQGRAGGSPYRVEG